MSAEGRAKIAAAMKRLPFGDEGEDAATGLASRIRAERGGRLPDLYRLLMHSPPMTEGWLALLTAVRQKNSLSGAMRELAILRVAVLNRSKTEYDAHVQFALEEGLSRDKIDGLASWKESTEFDDAERAVLRLADAMTLEIQVPAAVIDEVRRRFDVRQTTELVVTIAAYNMTTRFIEALDI